MAELDQPKCVFCGADWSEPMLERLWTSQGCDTCGYGATVSATLVVKCSSCDREVYRKDIQEESM